jgi:hypothetical protein
MGCVVAILIFILRFSSHLPNTIWNSDSKARSINDNLGSREGRIPVARQQSGKQFLYVIGNLLSQGLAFQTHFAKSKLYIYSLCDTIEKQ